MLTYIQFIKENKNEIDKLKTQLKEIDNWFENNNYGTPKWKNKWSELDKLRADKEKMAISIRKQLIELTGDGYGISAKEKAAKSKIPKGLYNEYDNPSDVPKKVYDYIQKNGSLLYDDASDAVRWSRIINTLNDERYSDGEMTIYRAVDNKAYDVIRAGDWVTTDESYAEEHNKRYFDGKGKIISMNVDGRDVLVSPTGNYEEAIYAPLKYSENIY